MHEKTVCQLNISEPGGNKNGWASQRTITGRHGLSLQIKL